MRSPALSIILPTDRFDSVAAVFERLVRQTIAARLEVIVVACAEADVAEMHPYAGKFAALRFIQTTTLVPLGVARAAGIRAATSEFVFIGETHSYLHPDAAEKLLATAQAGDWDVVVPGFMNANPAHAVSWGAFLTGYARWNGSSPASEIPESPLYDCLVRRDLLLRLPGPLEELFVHGVAMRVAMRAKKFRIYLEPAARLDHLNMENVRPFVHEHFLLGVFIAARRAQTWSWPRRLLYMISVPLVPLVLFRRVWPGVKIVWRAQPASWIGIPLVMLAFVGKAIGEFLGYAGGQSAARERMMTHYELRRIDYVH